MNVAIILGRTTTDIELRKTNSNKSVVNFTLAVNRKNGKNEADFFDCIAWDKTAETMARYVRKGSMIAVQGKLTTRVWEDKNGNKRKETEIVADNVSFCGEKKDAAPSVDVPPPTDNDAPEESGYREIPMTEEELPF